MSGWMIFGLILLSLGGLAYLALIDAKRRRTFRQDPVISKPLVWPACFGAFGPGIYLTIISHWSGLAIWAGAVTTLGWIMVAITPDTYARLRANIRARRTQVLDLAQHLVQHLSSAQSAFGRTYLGTWRNHLPRLSFAPMGPARPTEIDALKARIAALETRLQRMERGEDVERAEPAKGDETAKSYNEPLPVKPLDAAE